MSDPTAPTFDDQLEALGFRARSMSRRSQDVSRSEAMDFEQELEQDITTMDHSQWHEALERRILGSYPRGEAL